MNDGPPELWCLHGAVGEPADWQPLATRLAATGAIVRPLDLWRLLAGPPLPMWEFGRLLNVLARPPGGSPRVLIGYSMGGRLALHGLLHPATGPWDAAVIVSAHPGLEDAGERASRRAADAAWAMLANEAEWPAFLARWNARPLLAGCPLDRHALIARRREVARGFIDWSLGNQEPLWDRLAALHTPVLWVAGERDGKFLALAERAVAALPNGRLWVAPDAGHRVPWEAPAAFAAAVMEFLEPWSA